MASKDNKYRSQVRVSERLMAELRQFSAEETRRFGGAKKATPFGDLLERAWFISQGRPDPTPKDPEPVQFQQLREVLASSHEDLKQQIILALLTACDLIRLRSGNIH